MEAKGKKTKAMNILIFTIEALTAEKKRKKIKKTKRIKKIRRITKRAKKRKTKTSTTLLQTTMRQKQKSKKMKMKSNYKLSNSCTRTLCNTWTPSRKRVSFQLYKNKWTKMMHQEISISNNRNLNLISFRSRNLHAIDLFNMLTSALLLMKEKFLQNLKML